MNKKVLSAILFSALFAGTGTFTSCIDNDEPAGIEELRGAKAELIRAKVAVQEAEAAYKLAQAEVQKAEAAIKNAEAEAQKALTEKQELENELQSIENEEKRAEVEAAIAAAELAAKEAQVEHEQYMVELNQSLAVAKRSYELVLAQIEIAKATLSEKAQVTVGELQLAAVGAQSDVEDAQAKVEAKEEAYYNATLDAKKNEVCLKVIEAEVAAAESALAAAQNAYDTWNNFLAEDTETADWRAEITAIEDSIAVLGKKVVELELEKTKLQTSDEYMALQTAKLEAGMAYDEAVKAVNELALEAKVSYTYKYLTKADEKVTLAKGKSLVEAGEFIAGENFLKKDAKIAGHIADVENLYASYTEEKKAYLDAVAEADETNGLAKAKENSDKAVTAWTAALTAYNTAVANAKDVTTTAAENAYKAYKEALAAADLLVGNTAEQTAAKIAAAKVKANQNFADALVAYYNALPEGQVTFNKLTLPIYTYGKNAAGEIVVTKTTYTTKTVKEWLSDADNKDVYLQQLVDECFGANGFPAYWAVGSEWEVTYTTAAGEEAKYTTAKDAFGKIVKKADYIAAKKATLVEKSADAFGVASNYLAGAEFLTVQPSEADVKYVGYENAGKYGVYLGYEDAENVFIAKNYKAILEDYTAAIEFWTAELGTIKATIAEANDAVDAAEDAVDAAEDAIADYKEEKFGEVNFKLGDIQARTSVLNKIKSALTTAVSALLGETYEGAEAFGEWLKKMAADALDDVYGAEVKLIDAQNKLTKAQDGKLDPFANLAEAEEELAEAMAELAEAQAELETALANLAKGLEILAATNGAE